MHDIEHNTLSVGDKVVYVGGATKGAALRKGTITKIYGDQCSVDGHSHITEHRILKVAPK